MEKKNKGKRTKKRGGAKGKKIRIDERKKDKQSYKKNTLYVFYFT